MEASEYSDAGSSEKETFDPQEKKVPTKKEILNDIKKELKRATSAKTIIEGKISDWNDAYDGKEYGNEVIGRSSMVMKDVAKQIEWQKPNITEPFTSTENPVGTSALNAKSDKAATASENVLNYQYTSQFDRYSFMDTLANVLSREGTVWVRTGWEFKEGLEEKRLTRVDMNTIMQVQEEPTEITQNDDGSFNAVYQRKTIVRNQPTAKVWKNEDIFPDPLADSESTLGFVIGRSKMTITEMRNNPNFDQAAIDTIGTVDPQLYNDSALGADREAKGYDYGSDPANSEIQNNKKYFVYEYWGEYDINGNGISEQICFVWVDRVDVVLQSEENFLPGKRNPFISTPYSAVPFSLWGNGLPAFIEDNQKIRTMLMRGILDNMSLSNNGQKFIQKGTLDYTNWKRMKSGNKYIQVNKLDGITDGSFHELPQSVYNLYNMIAEDSEALTGISKMAQGLDPGSVANTAAGVQTMASMTQKRMLDVVRNISNLMTKVFTRWNDYNKMFLDVIEINNFSGVSQYEAADLKGDYHISLTVATDTNKQTKMQQYNLMLQQSASMAGSVPPQLMNMIYSKMLDLFDEPGMAEAVRTYQPQPDPHTESMKQAELAQAQADVQDTQSNALYKQANAGAKQKDIEKSDSEIDSMDMETTLSPQKMMQDFFTANNKPPQQAGGNQ